MKFLIHSFFSFALFTLMTSAGLAMEVKMLSLSYEPKQVEISTGQSITWKNTAYTEHSATSGATPPVFDTGMVSPGKESRAVRFEKPGTYKYHCSLHGLTMSGVVIVKAK